MADILFRRPAGAARAMGGGDDSTGRALGTDPLEFTGTARGAGDDDEFTGTALATGGDDDDDEFTGLADVVSVRAADEYD